MPIATLINASGACAQQRPMITQRRTATAWSKLDLRHGRSEVWLRATDRQLDMAVQCRQWREATAASRRTRTTAWRRQTIYARIHLPASFATPRTRQWRSELNRQVNCDYSVNLIRYRIAVSISINAKSIDCPVNWSSPMHLNHGNIALSNREASRANEGMSNLATETLCFSEPTTASA